MGGGTEAREMFRSAIQLTKKPRRKIDGKEATGRTTKEKESVQQMSEKEA